VHPILIGRVELVVEELDVTAADRIPRERLVGRG
jgi:hypothetical protein